MRFEGSPEVLRNLFRKKRLLDAGDVDHCRYRPLILACSGLMRGVYAGGQCRALDRFGLTKIFDTAVGISTGAPMLGFFLAGQIQQHLDIYWNEAGGDKFVSFARLWKGGRPVADTDYIAGVFRGKMDQGAIIRSRTKFYAAATCVRSGEGHLLDVKKVAPDPVEAMHASYAMPKLCGRVVTLDGTEYLDGAVSMSMPIGRIIEEFRPTDLLVLTNCADEEKDSAFANLLSALLVHDFPEPFRRSYLSRNKVFAEETQYLRKQRDCRYAILWTDKDVGRFERDPTKLEYAAVRAQAHLANLLGHAKADVEDEQSQLLAAE